MKLILAKFGWFILPIILFLLFLGLIWWFFSLKLKKISDSNRHRVVKALSFTFTGVLIALVLSSYRQDVPLSVGVKIEQIRQVEAQIEKEEEEKKDKMNRISEELEQALNQANVERDTHLDLKNNPSEVITVTWLEKYVSLANELSDKSLRDDYLRRLNNVKKHFFAHAEN